MEHSIWDLALFFFLYSIIGWVLEVVYCAAGTGKYHNRGMLAGTYCPIYGFGALLLITFLEQFKGNDLAIFIGSMALCSSLELVGGYLLEKLFRTRWWDYSDHPFNIGGYICLKMSLLWGVAGLVMMKSVHPILSDFVGWLSPFAVVLAAVVIGIIMLSDTIYTVAGILKLNREFVVLEKMHADLLTVSTDVSNDLSKKAIEADHQFQDLKKKADERYKMRIHQLGRSQQRLLKAFPRLKPKGHENILKRIKEELDLK